MILSADVLYEGEIEVQFDVEYDGALPDRRLPGVQGRVASPTGERSAPFQRSQRSDVGARTPSPHRQPPKTTLTVARYVTPDSDGRRAALNLRPDTAALGLAVLICLRAS